MMDQRILVTPLPNFEKEVLKLHQPIILINQEFNEKRMLYGKVESIGPGKFNPRTGTRTPVQTPLGAYIMYEYYSGHDLEIEGVIFRSMRDEEVLGIIEPEEDTINGSTPNTGSVPQTVETIVPEASSGDDGKDE